MIPKYPSRMSNSRYPLIILAVAAVTFVSCKPTEKNYKAAYDAALSKRQAEKEDPDMALMLGGHVLDTSEGSTAVKTAAGIQYPAKSTSLKFENEPGAEGEWYVAVSRFSMPTNARAQAADLTSSGCQAFVARDTEKQWYVIVKRTATRTMAGEAASEFIATHKDFPFTGLDGRPLLIVSSSR